MKRSNTRWETLELAMIRTAIFKMENGESMHQQLNWLYGDKIIPGRTRSAIRTRIQRMIIERNITALIPYTMKE